MRALALLTIASLGLACDAWLVGGECLPGYAETPGACVALAPGEPSGGAGGSGDEPEVSGTSGVTGGASATGGADPGCAPLDACAGACVDLQSDPASCGACGKVCVSGICEEGECIGEPAGHVVAIGIEPDVGSAMPARILANAVLLHPADPVRVAMFAGPLAKVSGVATGLATEVEARGRTMLVSHGTASQVAANLQAGQVDVLLVTPETLESAGVGGTVIHDLGPILTEFLGGGGVVVALASAPRPQELQDFLTQSGLLRGVEIIEADAGPYTFTSWSDALSIGVVSPFAGGSWAQGFRLPPEGEATTVVIDPEGTPVVVHRAIAPASD